MPVRSSRGLAGGFLAVWQSVLTLVVEDEAGEDLGGEEPEVVVRQPQLPRPGADQVANFLSCGDVAWRAGEEELLSLGEWLVDHPDTLEPLAQCGLCAHVLPPGVVRFTGDVLTREEPSPLGAVSVGGVTAARFQAPDRVLES